MNAPTRRGFGTTLIEESAKGEGGSARLSIESAGFAWEIVLPMPRVSAANVGDVGTNAERLKAERGPEEINGAAPRLAGKKLLVIEDETLVALEIMENLEDAGAHVLGPVGNPADALQVIESESFDATLLDANLHGKPVDEIAAALTRRQLPFAFVTGYGRESLPRTFGTAAILNNPLPGSSLSRPRVLF